jgi:hypothetical protein
VLAGSLYGGRRISAAAVRRRQLPVYSYYRTSPWRDGE